MTSTRPCGNCGTRTGTHSPDCLSDTQRCDRCNRPFDREKLDDAFICERCRIIEHIVDGVGPDAETIADKIESLAHLSRKRPEFSDRAKLVRETLLWFAGDANWERDVFEKIKVGP